MRTRLPRASTTASVARANTEYTDSDSAQAATAVSKQDLLQVLQQIGLLDTQQLFSGTLTADGRLSLTGPPVEHNLRCLLHTSMSLLTQPTTSAGSLTLHIT